MWADVRSVIDIAIVSFIIYRILVLLVGTRAIQLMKGVFILVALSAIALPVKRILAAKYCVKFGNRFISTRRYLNAAAG